MDIEFEVIPWLQEQLDPEGICPLCGKHENDLDCPECQLWLLDQARQLGCYAEMANYIIQHMHQNWKPAA